MLITALVSAGVAAVVTLMIEFTAKPALEVRKDRLVTAARAHRGVRSTLAGMGHEARRLLLASHHPDWIAASAHHEALSGRFAEWSDQHAQLRPRLRKRQREVANKIVGEVSGLLTRVEHVTWLASETSGDERRRLGDAMDREVTRLRDALVAAFLVYGSSGWSLARRRDCRRAERIVESLRRHGNVT